MQMSVCTDQCGWRLLCANITIFVVRFRTPLPLGRCGSSMGMDCSVGWHRAEPYHLDLAGSLDKTTPLQRDSHSLSEEGRGREKRRGGRRREVLKMISTWLNDQGISPFASSTECQNNDKGWGSRTPEGHCWRWIEAVGDGWLDWCSGDRQYHDSHQLNHLCAIIIYIVWG